MKNKNSKKILVFLLSFLLVGVGVLGLSTKSAHAAVTFAADVTYPEGAGPYSITKGDFNGDGITDLAAANVFGNTESVLLGAANGTFGTAVQYAVGAYPLLSVAADFNGDGKTDLAVTNNGGDVSILLGRGDGTFNTAVNYPVGSWPVGVVAGDFNGDGKLDLAVTNYDSNNISVLLGDGFGVFGTATNYPVGTGPEYIIMGDFNSDGNLDLAAAKVGVGGIAVLLGTGSGTFGPAVSYATGNHSSFSGTTVVAGYFNTDAILDLAVTNNADHNISVLLGSSTGDGTFGLATNTAMGASVYGMATGDFNADGKTDLVVDIAGSKESVLLGGGDGTFGPKTDYAVGNNWALVTGDFNADGKTDIAGVDQANPGGKVHVLLNTTTDPTTTAPVATKPTASQTSASLVTATSTIVDADRGTTSVSVEYSTNNVTWHNATIASASENNEGNGVTVSTNTISGIDTTNDGSVDLTFAWNIATDIPNTNDLTVFLRITPNNGTATGTTMYSSAFAVDTLPPVFSSVSPTASTSINNVTSSSDVSYTLSEAVASGTIVITETSDGLDIGSPHTCTLVGTAKNIGAHANFDLSDTINSCVADSSGLVNGAVYTFAFNATDDAGNTAAPVSAASVTFDNTAPTAAITYSKDVGVTYASTISVKDPDTLRIKATFNEPLADVPVVKIAVDNAVLPATNMVKVSSTEYTYDLNVPVGNIPTATVSMSIGTDVAGNVITAIPTSGATFTIDNTLPTLAEVLAVPTTSSNTTPGYTFSASEGGTISYTGSCSSLTTNGISGSNAVTFAALAIGTYSNCRIIVTDAALNASAPLSVNTFNIVAQVNSSNGGGGSGPARYNAPSSTKPTPPIPPTGTIIPPTPPIIPGSVSFNDIQTHWAQTYIEKLQQKCGVDGYRDEDGNLLHEYRPEDPISRAELVKIVMQCKFTSLEPAAENPFLDVSKDDWFGPAVYKAKSLGIVIGINNEFLPYTPITRAEALKIVLLSTYADKDIHGGTLSFTDVVTNEWFVKYIAFAVENGFVSGYVDAQGNSLNLFGPTDPLTRAEAAKIIVKVLGY